MENSVIYCVSRLKDKIKIAIYGHNVNNEMQSILMKKRRMKIKSIQLFRTFSIKTGKIFEFILIYEQNFAMIIMFDRLFIIRGSERKCKKCQQRL